MLIYWVWYNIFMANDILYTWEIDEYLHHERTRMWYVLFFALTAVLTFYALFTANFLFLFIVLMAAAILLLQHNRAPRRLKVELSREGLRIGQEQHFWNKMDYFWIVDEPEVKSLYFETKETLKPHLCVSLRGQNIEKIRSLLKPFLKEEPQEEPLSDILSRLLGV